MEAFRFLPFLLVKNRVLLFSFFSNHDPRLVAVFLSTSYKVSLPFAILEEYNVSVVCLFQIYTQEVREYLSLLSVILICESSNPIFMESNRSCEKKFSPWKWIMLFSM